MAFMTFKLLIACLFSAVIAAEIGATQMSQNQNKPDEQLFEQAYIAFKTSRFNEATLLTKKIIQQSPSHLPTRLLFAEILIATHKGVLAESELNIAKNLGADKDQLILLYGESHLLQSKYQEVLKLEDDGLFNGDSRLLSKVHVLKGKAHIGLRQLELAEAQFKKALFINSKNKDATLGLAQVFINYYKFEQAEKLVDQVLSSYLPSAEAWRLKASINHSLDRNLEALQAITTSIELNNENYNAYILRATIYVELRKYELANSDIDRALELFPFEPRAEYIKAILLLKSGNNEKAKETIDDVLTTLMQIPKDVLNENPTYYYLASYIFYYQGNYKLASENINYYLQLDQYNTKAMRLSALISLAQKNYDLANSILNKANITEENNPKTLALLGIVSLEMQQYKRAQHYFESAKNIAPYLPQFDLYLARNYIAMGDNSLAIKTILNNSSTLMDELTASFLLVEAYIKTQQLDKAIALAQKMMEQYPQDPDIIHHLGYLLNMQGESEKATTLFNSALTINKDHAKSIISLAKIEIANNKIEQAISRLSNAYQLLPENIDIITFYANVLMKLGKSEDALSLFQSAYEKEPNNYDLVKQLSHSLIAMNKANEAIEVLLSFEIKQGKNVRLSILLGQLYSYVKMYKQAIISYQDALKSGANKSQVHQYIAQAYLKSNNKPQSIEAYERSIAWNSSNLTAISELANIYISNNNAELALETIEKYNKQLEIPVELQILKARSYYMLAQYNKAEAIYKKILNNNTNENIEVIISLNQLLIKQHRYKEAESFIETWLLKKPTSVLFNTSLAEIYTSQNLWANADKIYTLILTQVKNQPALLNNASFIAMKLQQYDKATTLAQQSLDIISDQPDSLDTLGWIYYQTEEYEKALPLFRKAIAIDFSRLDIKFHIALTLKALDRNKEAIEMMIEVVDSHNFSESKKAKQLLEQWFNELNTSTAN